MFGGAPFDEEKKKKLDEAYEFLNKYLEGGKWAAGDNYTLADIALAASVSTAEVNPFYLPRESIAMVQQNVFESSTKIILVDTKKKKKMVFTEKTFCQYINLLLCTYMAGNQIN